MIFESYHAHVYYNEATRAHAKEVRGELARRFPVALGRWHDAPVGPHPSSMYQVAFPSAEFADVVPWLMANHGPLSVLIHPNTDDDLGDHSDRALWLGHQLTLNLNMFRQGGEG